MQIRRITPSTQQTPPARCKLGMLRAKGEVGERKAGRGRRGGCLELRYDGFIRVVEVHAVGLSRDGAVVTRVWQVRGGSRSGRGGWKLLSLRETASVDLTDKPSLAPRDGFNPDDPAMGGGIICAAS